jgi:hypothetical protein
MSYSTLFSCAVEPSRAVDIDQIVLPKEVPVYWMDAIDAGPLSVIASARLSKGDENIIAEFKLPSHFKISDTNQLDCRLSIASNRWPYATDSVVHYWATALEVRRHA